jgi:hypothetical protein
VGSWPPQVLGRHLRDLSVSPSDIPRVDMSLSVFTLTPVAICMECTCRGPDGYLFCLCCDGQHCGASRYSELPAIWGSGDSALVIAVCSLFNHV